MTHQLATVLQEANNQSSEDTSTALEFDAPAWINGVYRPLSELQIPALDRGFLFADGVYEVIPIYNRQLFRWSAHRDRLRHSLRGLLFPDDCVDDQQLAAVARRLIGDWHLPHAVLYLQITRGAYSQRDHRPPKQITPTIVMWLMPLPSLLANPVALRLKSCVDIRWQWCHLKTIALLGNVLMREQAHREGYDDALLVRDGCVTEASSANCVLIRSGKLLVPDSDDALLPGITRQVICDIAQREQIDWQLCRPPPLQQALEADEVWLCSSTKLMSPVCAIDHHQLADYRQSGVGLSLLAAFIAMIDHYHPDQDG